MRNVPKGMRIATSLALLAMTGIDCIKLLDLRQTTPCSPTLIRLASLSTFPVREGMNGAALYPKPSPAPSLPLGEGGTAYGGDG